MSQENVEVDQRVLHAADNNARLVRHRLPLARASDPCMDGRIWAAPQAFSGAVPGCRDTSARTLWSRTCSKRSRQGRDAP